MERKYRRKAIPKEAWSYELKTLFYDLKELIISSPLLACYDPSKPTFLKTDWSAHGMGYILCQPDDSPESSAAITTLQSNGTCLFDLTLQGPCLRPILFGSRSCLQSEQHFHSFVGEIACGRWAIAQNKNYLWGTHFYWLCDCNSVKEILNYNGSIHMLNRWAMELLGYNFAILHRPSRMMTDVDALTRRFEPHYARYVNVAAILAHIDKQNRPNAYKPSTFPSKPTRLYTPSTSPRSIPILTSNIIDTVPILLSTKFTATRTSTLSTNTTSPFLQTLPIAPVFTTTSIPSQPQSHSQHHSNILDYFSWSSITWLCIDDVTHSFTSTTSNDPSLAWNIINVFTHPSLCKLIDTLTNTKSVIIDSISNFISTTNVQHPNLHHTLLGCDFHFIYTTHHNLHSWLSSTITSLNTIINTCVNFTYACLWIPGNTFPSTLNVHNCISTIQHHLPNTWMVTPHSLNPTSYNCPIHCTVMYFTLSYNDPNTAAFHSMPPPLASQSLDYSFSRYLFSEEKYKPPPPDNFTIPIPSNLVVRPPPPSNYCISEPRIIAHMNFSEESSLSSTSSISNLILCTLYPAYPPSSHVNPNDTMRSFQIPSWSDITENWEARPLNFIEFFNIYTNNNPLFQSNQLYTLSSDTLFDILCTCIPHLLHKSILSHYVNTGLFDNFIFNEDIQLDSAQCFTLRPLPTSKSWTEAYQSDPDTSKIITLLNNKTIMSQTTIKDINSSYHEHLLANRIQLQNKRLTLTKHIPTTSKSIQLIIVPLSLRRLIFDHYHGGPTGGHMGEYKTLYRLRMRFFWPKMRSDVKNWVTACAECIVNRTWKNRKNDLYFSWPVTIPFWILHCDIWSPGNITDSEGNTSVLNCMCDLTQFVVSIITSDTTAASLSQLIMEHVLLKYGMCAVIVVDAASNFKGIFEQMCSILSITFWPLSRGNHHGLSVERYHRFLNKTQTIQVANVGTHSNFKRTVLLSAYSWNSSPIDGTDIIRSIPAVGRMFRFPLDSSISPLPPLNDSANT